MFGTGLLAGLIAKLTGLGSVAKVAIASVTAALTMTLAGGAAGVLPFAGSHSVPAVTQGVIDQTPPAGDIVVPPTTGGTAVQTDTPAAVTAATGSTSASANVGAGVEAPAGPAPSPATPSLPVPGVAMPDLSGLSQVPAQVLSCLTPVLDLVGGLPAVTPQQISQIGPGIVSCVSGIVSNLPLPSGLNACISGILGFVSDLSSQLPTGVPNFGNLDLAACIPAGLPVPTGPAGGIPFMGGGFSFGHH